MTTREEILEYIKSLAEQQVVTKEELVAAYDSGTEVVHGEASKRKVSIAEILYFIGGGTVFLGITILVIQNWDSFNFVTKVLTTLGSGALAYAIGVVLGRKESTETVGSAFYLISALVTPVGLYVVFNDAGYELGTYELQILIAGIMLGIQLVSLLWSKKSIFTLFSIIFGTLFFFSLTSWIGDHWSYASGERYREHQILVVGFGYMVLGYIFSKGKQSSLKGFLYGFGIFGFLGAAFLLGGWDPEQSIIWEVIFPVLVFGALFLSVYIKSKTFLVAGTIFLMAYIIKITSEYFSQGLGWPLSLVVAGLGMIAVGNLSIYINRKYLKS